MKILNYLLMCMATLLMACSAPKEVLYLQDISLIKEEVIDKSYEVIIHKDDLLAIIVNSKDPELALPFNMPLASYPNRWSKHQSTTFSWLSCQSKR